MPPAESPAWLVQRKAIARGRKLQVPAFWPDDPETGSVVSIHSLLTMKTDGTLDRKLAVLLPATPYKNT